MIASVLIGFLVLLLAGAPIFFAVGFASLIPNIITGGKVMDGAFLIRGMMGGVDSSTLIAIPLFVLSGFIMGAGGVSEKLFNVFALIVGKQRAGLPIAVVLTACVYGAICGTGSPAAAAIGAMCIPMLINLGYSKEFSASIVAAGGGIGLIIPPSLGYVMYGSLTGTSVAALFTAGFIPGLVIAGCLIAYCIVYCSKNGEDREKILENYEKLKSRGVWNVLKDSFFAILAPVTVLGFIYGGITTPTEAAVISVWYALLVCVFIYKTIKFKDIIKFLVDTVNSYSGIICITAFGFMMAKMIAYIELPKVLGEFLLAHVSSQGLLLALVLLVMFVIGMFMDVMPTLIILSPVLFPIVVNGFGVNPVHFGIIMTGTVALGLITPPYGLNIFVTAAIAGIDAGKLFKQCIFMSICYVIALLLITYIPAISLSLGNLLAH